VSDDNAAREALQKHFGFTEFREGQAEVIERVLAGRDVVVVMPTGGGKSLCYQLPALMMDGVTLVVSPLIALMKDQVDQLTARGIPTTFINSSLSYSETNIRLSKLRLGAYKLLYVAPERFRSQAFMDSIAETRVQLLAVDEAHCISHWGHDFRPDYLKLKEAAERLGRPQIIALTATATPQVRGDISQQLGLTDPHVSVAGFDRPNLALRVLEPKTDKEKYETLKRIIEREPGTGIIYAATRKSVEQIAARLKLAGLRVEPYHAGLPDSERNRAQDAFMRGEIRAIIATNAFGMGIDKSDIRFVIHFQFPGSIEAYYQEIGRAGRDGGASDCVCLFNYADKRYHDFFIDGSYPSAELIKAVYQKITSFGMEKIELSARELAQQIRLRNAGRARTADEMSVYSSLVLLERAGHIERGRSSNSTALARMVVPIDVALEAVSDEATEGAVLRELIFMRNVSEREQTEIDVTAIAAGLGLSDGQMRRALAGLAARNLVAVENTYQGRGIRLLDEKPVLALRVDMGELEARRAAEQAKLRRMIDYCYHEGCLRRFILNYFGDRKRLAHCGTCSSCAPGAAAALDKTTATAKPATAGTLSMSRAANSSSESQPTDRERALIDNAPSGNALKDELRRRADHERALHAPPGNAQPIQTRRLNEAETIVIKKILSCVARIEKEYGKNKFGKGTVAAVLRGSTSKQVRESKLDQLSTYGLLRDMIQDEITLYIKALIAADCIAVAQGAYPTVSLTDFGREVMTSRAEVMLELP
jgi:ATP-dependent DNA helicase RecQ